MIFAIILFLIGVLTAATAAFFSIDGLTALFAAATMTFPMALAAPIPIIIMGLILEAGKIGAAVWLHRFWHQAQFFLKWYLLFAVMALMLITSIGIFGFLSKSHLDQSNPLVNSQILIDRIDLRIGRSKTRSDRATAVLQKMDEALQVQINLEYATRAQKRRIEEAPERARLQAIIDSSEQKIAELLDEKLIQQQKTIDVNVKLGPIKYLSALLGLEDRQSSTIRGLIVLIMFAFDPVAIALIIAAQWIWLLNYSQQRKTIVNSRRKIIVTETEIVEPNAVVEDVEEIVNKEPVDEIKLNVPEEVTEVEEPIKQTKTLTAGQKIEQEGFIDSDRRKK